MPQRPLLLYNPYHFMTYPYTIPPAPPFYGYFQKPIQPAVPNSYTLHKFSEWTSFILRQIKFNIHQFHFFHSKFFIYKPISINFKFNEKYNNIELKKVNCGKILNVLTKSWSVETRNLTKSRVTQGGFLLKCVRYSQSLDGDVQFHSPTYVYHYNKATTCNHK